MATRRKYPRRVVYHVQPVRGGWVVKNGRQTLTGIYARKQAAVTDGRCIARGERNSGSLAQLVIHGRDGRIQTEHTYGRDPERRAG